MVTCQVRAFGGPCCSWVDEDHVETGVGVAGDAADVRGACSGDVGEGEDLGHAGEVGVVDGYGGVPEGST